MSIFLDKLDLDDVLVNFKVYGRYHAIACVLLILGAVIETMWYCNYVFVTEEVGYRCADDILLPENRSDSSTSNTVNYTAVWCRNPSSCSEWIYDDPDSFVAEFQLACQDWKRTLIGSVHSFGYMIGLLIVGPLSDRFGRKPLIIVTGIAGAVLGTVKTFVSSYWCYVALELLEAAIGDFCSPLYMLGLEMVATKSRVTFSTLCNMGFGIGGLLLPLLAWLIPYWRTLLRVLYIPGLLSIFLIYLLDESPRWLLVKGNKSAALEIIRNAAKMNKIEINGNLNLISFEKDNESSFVTALGDTFKSRSILKRLFVCIVWWVTCTLVNYGMALNSVILQGNKYFNFAMSSTMDILSFTLGAYILKKFNRTGPLITSFLACAIFCIGQPFEFWKCTNRMNTKPGRPASVDGISDPKQIAELFKDQFLVRSPLGPSHAGCEAETITIGTKITAEEVTKTIKKMSGGKSPGHDGLSIEHLQCAGPHLPRVLAMLYTLCLGHSYLPAELMKTVVVPIVKNKTGDTSDKTNYRPISLATVVAKILDSLLNTQLDKYIQLHDNQFGFRPGLSTESAILCLKQTVRYYTDRDTPVYACFLDLSRAFDLVCYDILWRKLEEMEVPPDLISIFKFWYTRQVNSVRWAGALSEPYSLECGVRQGGLTSPKLFNLYVNGLIAELSSTHVGCHVQGVCINNISYADDMVLLSASPCGLARLITVCEQYAAAHGLKYNSVKSEMMVFGVRDLLWLVNSTFMAGKLMSSIAFNTVYIFTSELFPTHTRNSMHALCSSIGRIGSIIAPQLPLLMVYWTGLPNVIFGAVSLVAGLLTLLAPDTADRNLPDTVGQAEALEVGTAKVTPGNKCCKHRISTDCTSL